MSKIIIFVISVIAILVVGWLIKHFLFNRPNTNSSTSNATQASNNGTNSPNQPLPENNLTLQERIELSWRFLKDIAASILNFSSIDKQRIKIAGDILKKYSMKYQHVVDNSITKYIGGKQVKQEKEMSRK